MSDDLLQGLRDVVGDVAPEAELGPKGDMNDLLKALEQLPGLSDEYKETLVKNLAKGRAQPPVNIGVATNPWVEFSILIGIISLMALVIAFIGYRLYENMALREKRRELKKRRKEQKKK